MKKSKRTAVQNMLPGFTREKEDMLAALSEAVRGKDFSNEAELNAFLEQFVGMKMSDVTASLAGEQDEWSVQEQAEDLFFEAMEARTAATCRKKLKEVLKLDPDHVRALTALAKAERKPQDVEKGFRQAIAAGARKLGPLLEEGAGQLWGLLEARPYMEARAELALFLANDEERLDEAIAEHQELLRLNENDNQGIRDPLLGLLLEKRRFDEARALVKKYDTNYAATWMYAKALLEFQKCAELAKWDTNSHDAAWLEEQMKEFDGGTMPILPKSVRLADRVLIKALKFNPWAAIYLMNPGEHLDEERPSFYSAGSEDEARIFLECQGGAWVKSPSALVWLMLVAMPWLTKNGFADEVAPE
jgi:tetratricopeptide (TPR) repeat protein